MASLEIQKSAPSWAPAKAPEDTLLKNFRATLEKRWNEFDRATMQEAIKQNPLGQIWAQSLRDSDSDFINAKSTFDEAMQALNSIDTDAKLKQILETPGRLSSTINTLKDYLAKADKQKSYNTVLSHTLADLTGLKAQITEKPEDKKAAELAQAAVPALAVTTTWALTTDAMTGLSDAIKDGAQSLKWEVSAVKNNPMKKIVEFFGFTESSILNDFKGALAEKKAGGFDGVFAGIKIWFYGFLAKLTGVDIAKSLTPEELKLAGIKGSVVPQNPEVKPEQSESMKKWLSNEAYRVTTWFLVRGTNQVRYNNIITSIYAGVRDATWWKDEIEKKQMIENEAITLLSSEGSKLRSMSYSDIAKKSESDILLLVWNWSELTLRKSAISLIQKMLWENKWVFEKVFSDIPDWDKQPLDKIIGILYQEKWYQHISQMYSRLESIKLSDIGDIPKNLFLDLSWKDGNLVIGEGIFSGRYDAMKSMWLTPGLIKKLHIDNETAESNVTQFRWNISTVWDNLEQKFADNFSNPDNFLIPLQNSLKQKFGYSDSLIAELSPSKLKVRDLFDIYMITGGKTSIDQLNIWEKNLLLTKLQAYFIRTNPEEHGKYITTILQYPDKYPEVIQAFELISSLVNKTAYKSALISAGVTDSVINSVLGMFDIDTKSEKAAALAASIWVIWLAMKLLPIGRLISLITLILASLGVAWLATAQQGIKK